MDLTKVPFYDDELQAARDERGIWVPIRPVCEALGLAVQSQLEKLKNKPWATITMIVTVADDGKPREMACLHLDALPMWLATIDPSRVGEHARHKLERYQREAARVLADHFLGSRPEAVCSVLAPETMAVIERVADGIAGPILGSRERHRTGRRRRGEDRGRRERSNNAGACGRASPDS